MSHNQFIEGLESRQFLSAAPVFDAAVVADRLVVRADLLKFQSDICANDAKLLTDVQNIKKNLAKGDKSLAGAFAQLHSATKTMRLDLLEDRLTEAANALADESTIKLDELQMLKDLGKTDAESTDRAKLVNDRVALQEALINGLDARINTRQMDESTIAVDSQAIVTAADNDPAATDGLKAAAATFAGDRVTCLNTLTNDLTTISSARTTLANALAAQVNDPI